MMIDSAITPLPQVIKGKSDWRNYRSIRLSNGVTCILVQDKESKTTACSVAVAVGASSDPREMSGLAHFTEHMCFLGSTAYPGENEYKKYLSTHGGRSNASTSMSTTTYKCEVLAEHAEGAIDIFANFFVSPLFTRSGTGREVNAVDSENSKNITNDSRRRLQILKALADPTHHYSKFSTGDAKTLPANGMEKVDSESQECASPGQRHAAGKSKTKLLESKECASPDRAAGTSEAKHLERDRSDSPGRAAGKAKTENLESKGCASPDRAAGKPKTELLENKGELVRDSLLAFHKRYYRPNNMTVAIVGPQDLDRLQELIVPRFAGIKDQWEQKDEGEMTEAERIVDFASKDAPEVSFGSPSIHNPAFRPGLQGGQWPILLTTLPLQSMRKLYLYFPLPPTIHLEDKSPHQLVSHLLGHEGQGSVFSILQDESLADSLSAGSRLSERDQSMLQISVSLTKKGEAQWEKVVKIVFEYCRLLETTINSAKQTSDCTGSKDARQELRDIWSDKSKLASLRFHQTSPGPAFGFAPALASSAMKFGSEKCLSSGSLLDETEESLDLNILSDFVGRLIPSNCILERCSQTAWDEQMINTESHNEFDPIFGLKTEPWYGVQYYLSKVKPSTVSEWSKSIDFADRIHLPEQNRYIPRNLELCADLPPEAKLGPRIGKKLEPPNLTVKEEYGRLWHRLDDRYCLPQATITFLIRNPKSENKWDEASDSWIFDTDVAVQSALICSSFSEALAQETYDASVAGLGWSLSKSPSGFTLSCSGYSEHLSELALTVLKDFYDGTFLQERFINSSKDRNIQFLKSYLQSNRADSHASYYASLLLSSQGGGVDRTLEATESISFERIRAHYHSVISTPATVDCLVSGNISEEDAKTFFDRASRIIEQKREPSNESKAHSWVPGPFERSLNPGEDVHLHFQSLNPQEVNGAVRMTFQSLKPGYRGSLSDSDTILKTAAIRVICQILKEPLFNQLRTKEQLGYIVSSGYDLKFCIDAADSYQQNGNDSMTSSTTPINSIVINVLSKKISPEEVTIRIDEFLTTFRERLIEMPDSEIQSHKGSLSTKLVKPIQKLNAEVGRHFSKIRRYAPEIVKNNHETLPWDSTTHLAESIKSLSRQDIIDTWDDVVAGKDRARVVSHVYGSTFPLPKSQLDIQEISPFMKENRNIIHLKSREDIFQKREGLSRFSRNLSSQSGGETMANQMRNVMRSMDHRTGVMAGVIGLGLASFAIRSFKSDKSQDKK